jgi:iron(III) transport system substrate-binding protein
LFDGGATFYPINAAGFAAPYKPAAAAVYPAEFKDPSGYWTANIVQVVSPAINTDLVPASDAPKTLDDLLDSKWRGRMAWTDAPSAGGPPGFIGAVLLSLGKEKGMEFLTKLAEQRIANIPSNQRVVLDQNIGGQYPLVLCIFNYHAAISASQGAPVKWLKVLPILTFGTVAMVKNGPHPNATKLFIEFMLSEEGQKIHADAGYIPAHPNVPAKSPDLKPEVGKYEYKLVTAEMYNAHAAEWTSIYKKLFQ